MTEASKLDKSKNTTNAAEGSMYLYDQPEYLSRGLNTQADRKGTYYLQLRLLCFYFYLTLMPQSFILPFGLG